MSQQPHTRFMPQDDGFLSDIDPLTGSSILMTPGHMRGDQEIHDPITGTWYKGTIIPETETETPETPDDVFLSGIYLLILAGILVPSTMKLLVGSFTVPPSTQFHVALSKLSRYLTTHAPDVKPCQYALKKLRKDAKARGLKTTSLERQSLETRTQRATTLVRDAEIAKSDHAELMRALHMTISTCVMIDLDGVRTLVYPDGSTEQAVQAVQAVQPEPLWIPSAADKQRAPTKTVGQ
jgi:hypothetical protein